MAMLYKESLFGGAQIVQGSQSNFGLFISEGDMPAEKFIVDPTLPILFTYPYGGTEVQDVVIAKGMVVAIKGFTKDVETGKMVPVITIADGTNIPIGIAPYNFAKEDIYRFKGNRPAVLRKGYLQLPYIPDPNDAAAVNHGVVTGEDLQLGDFLKPAPGGKLTKWIEGQDSVKQIVGQVLALELDQEPHGLLKYVMWPEEAKYQDYRRPEGLTDQLNQDEGFPYDPKYRDGTLNKPDYLNQYLLNPTGIPGLTDGMGRSYTVWKKVFTIPAGSTAGTKFVYTMDHKDLIKESVKVFINNTEVPATNISVDAKAGVVTVTLPADITDATPIEIQYRALFYGTPPAWNYKGAVGAVRFVLKF